MGPKRKPDGPADTNSETKRALRLRTEAKGGRSSTGKEEAKRTPEQTEEAKPARSSTAKAKSTPEEDEDSDEENGPHQSTIKKRLNRVAHHEPVRNLLDELAARMAKLNILALHFINFHVRKMLGEVSFGTLETALDVERERNAFVATMEGQGFSMDTFYHRCFSAVNEQGTIRNAMVLLLSFIIHKYWLIVVI